MRFIWENLSGCLEKFEGHAMTHEVLAFVGVHKYCKINVSAAGCNSAFLEWIR